MYVPLFPPTAGGRPRDVRGLGHSSRQGRGFLNWRGSGFMQRSWRTHGGQRVKKEPARSDSWTGQWVPTSSVAIPDDIASYWQSSPGVLAEPDNDHLLNSAAGERTDGLHQVPSDLIAYADKVDDTNNEIPNLVLGDAASEGEVENDAACRTDGCNVVVTLRRDDSTSVSHDSPDSQINVEYDAPGITATSATAPPDYKAEEADDVSAHEPDCNTSFASLLEGPTNSSTGASTRHAKHGTELATPSANTEEGSSPCSRSSLDNDAGEISRKRMTGSNDSTADRQQPTETVTRPKVWASAGGHVEDHHVQGSTLRPKNRACQQCASAKVRCMRENPSVTCGRCSRRGDQCITRDAVARKRRVRLWPGPNVNPRSCALCMLQGVLCDRAGTDEGGLEGNLQCRPCRRKWASVHCQGNMLTKVKGCRDSNKACSYFRSCARPDCPHCA